MTTTIQWAGNAPAERVAWVGLLIDAIIANGWVLPDDIRIAHRHANSAWANGIAEAATRNRCHLTLHVGDSALDTGFVLIRELGRTMAEDPVLQTQLRHTLCKTVLVPLTALADWPALVTDVDAEAAYGYCLVRDRGKDLPWPTDLSLDHPCARSLAAKVRYTLNHRTPTKVRY